MLFKVVNKIFLLLSMLVIPVMVICETNANNDLSLGIDVSLCAYKTQDNGMVKKTLSNSIQHSLKLTGKMSENTNFVLGLGSTGLGLQTCNIIMPHKVRKFTLYDLHTDIIKDIHTLVDKNLVLHGSIGISYLYWNGISTGTNSDSYLKALGVVKLKYKWDPTLYSVNQGITFRLGTGFTYNYTDKICIKATTIYSQFVTTQYLFKSLTTYGIGIHYNL